jgi:hypothetical protein
MLSKKEKKELSDKMDSLADDYMKKEIPNANLNNVEMLSFVLTYRMTANLVKHSRTLTIWTIVIAISTILLLLSTIIVFNESIITFIQRLCSL